MTKKEYYIFDTEAAAKAACDTMATVAGLPVIHGPAAGRHGETTCWDTPRARADGKWVVERLTDSLRAQYAAHEAAFDAAHPHTIEEEAADWWQE